MANSVPGVANLATQTGETMRIEFSADYSGATPGSSSWSIVANEVRITVTVPPGLPKPAWFLGQLLGQTKERGGRVLVDQCVLLQEAGGVFSGTAAYGVLIRSGQDGLDTSYDQLFEFTPAGGGFGVQTIAFVTDHAGGSLQDPINGTRHFQTNLFFATPYAGTDQGNWDNI